MVLELSMSHQNIPDITVDKYEETVELQNNCRSFYLNRKKASEDFKQSLNEHSEKNVGIGKRTSLSTAMDKLREEMASLVDQDLSLMKQLMTLNETIEEIKTKRLYGVSKDSVAESIDGVDRRETNMPQSMSTISLNSDH
ncbi:Hypothetical predicted protein [Mytilus galloprovincialis]|uniref:Uncharacterized protein n=1 Tax=Mytilus galloprovincialis TaxID=29158 RepID=A0A8B6CPZ8_MYTGA|nr:Hypothetical predicted protein [Mytilus galloprovincialis]